MRPASIPLALALALVLSAGCCPMARWFCGPDRTPWISIDYSTPEAAVKTFLEALRRDEPKVVYQSISHAYRKELDVDDATIQLAWPKVKEQYPYLHVAGYAEVLAAKQDGDVAQLDLSIAGHRLRLDVRRQRKWEVRYPFPSGAAASPGSMVRTFQGLVEITEDTDDTGKASVDIKPLVVRKGDYELRPDQLQFAGVVAEWKVNHVDPLTDG